MSSQSRRSSFSSSTISSMAKRQSISSASDNAGKPMALRPNSGKKRAPLNDISNLKNCSRRGSKAFVTPSKLVTCTNKKAIAKAKNTARNCNAISSKVSAIPNDLEVATTAATISITPQCDMDVSPSQSDCVSISLCESMSTSDSFKSPKVEYIDSNDILELFSVNKKTLDNLYISKYDEKQENACKAAFSSMESCNKVVDVDVSQNPQLCAMIACDIYKHLRASEKLKRPSTDYMEIVQVDINGSMRAILIDWLVEVAEEYRLVPDTLYLAVNYIDRYLSGNVISRQKLQLLGVSCMMIASKYEEICAPQVEEFCYITDNTYFKNEILEMETAVLNYLKFELTAPTAKCFLRRFVHVTQGVNEKIPSMQLECLANYITELSLLEYNMLRYAPSLIAASAIFLALFILFPSDRPWNSTLQHYTLYRPSDMYDCVRVLHGLCSGAHNSLPAIRDKYSQHKYKFVAKKYCPTSIPLDYFQNQN